MSIIASAQMVTSSSFAERPLADARAQYQAVRARTLELTRGLTAEDQAIQSMPDASPVKWHLAHTTWFFETFLLRSRPQYKLFDARFGVLFNSYYNAEGAQHPRAERGLLSRPGLEDVLAYRAHVDEAVAACAEEVDSYVLTLGLAHEEQHQELILMDVKHLFSCNPLAPALRPRQQTKRAAPAPATWIACEGGVFELGHDGEGFAFDNEGPQHRVFIEPFQIADRLVTTSEFAQFVADGGYRRPELWLSDGWDAVVANGWEAPLYWRRESDRWSVFTFSGFEPLSPHAPVCHVSYYEADAYARWAGKRLPAEAEWEHAAKRAPHALTQAYDAAWQWTSSAYAPYPRYRPARSALGEYNGKFMSNRMVLRGGSVATPPGHARATYRNFFPPGARWAFSGIRLADDA